MTALTLLPPPLRVVHTFDCQCRGCRMQRTAEAHAAFITACERFKAEPCTKHKLLVLGAYEMFQDAIRERDRL